MISSKTPEHDALKFQNAVARAKQLRWEELMSYDAIAKKLMNEGYRTKTGLKVFGVGMIFRMCRGDFG